MMPRTLYTLEHRIVHRAEAVPVLACRMPWEDPATAFRSAGTFIPPEIAAKKAAAAIAEAQALTDQAQVQTQLHAAWQLALASQPWSLHEGKSCLWVSQQTSMHAAAYTCLYS